MSRKLEAMKQLWQHHQKRDKLIREMAHRVVLDLALAATGVDQSEVDHFIYGAQISRIDNYKRRIPIKVCNNRFCDLQGRPQGNFENCDECDTPLSDSTRPINFQDLHGPMAKWVVGVLTKTGRRVWFAEPVPEHPWVAWDREQETGPKQRPNLPLFSSRRAVRAGRGF